LIELLKGVEMSAIPDLERVVFFPGELLTADDLTTLDGNNQQLRWLHNRTLHNWGIGMGFDVIGTRGSTSVKVSPGYAIDSLGREIILSNSVTQPIPAVPSGTYYLVADWVGDSGQTAEEQRSATACNPGGAVRLSNDPAINWKALAQLDSGIDIVLAQVVIQNCVLGQNPSMAPRRYSASGSMPYIKAGEVSASALTWNPWPQGFTAAIDTSAAKFQTAPVYLAQIIGGRSIASPPLLVVDYLSIASASRTGFTLQVALPALGGNINPSGQIAPSTFSQLNWQVVWLGIEG
jgi:hypothetical protein